MPEIRLPLFGKIRKVEQQIDHFLDRLSEAGLLLEKCIICYLECGLDDDCLRHQGRVSTLEKECDSLRRDIEATLLTEALIPESRSDVLRLIDDLDALMDEIKDKLLSMTIEAPAVPNAQKDDLRKLVQAVANSVESGVLASRAYFVDPRTVRDHVHKISFHESESDAVAIRMKMRAFSSNKDLAEKMLMRDFVDAIDGIADLAEDVGDRLSNYVIKRTL